MTFARIGTLLSACWPLTWCWSRCLQCGPHACLVTPCFWGGLLSVSWFLCLQCGTHACLVTPCFWGGLLSAVSWFLCLQCGPRACVVNPCLWVVCCLSAGFSACNVAPMSVWWPLASEWPVVLSTGFSACNVAPMPVWWTLACGWSVVCQLVSLPAMWLPCLCGDPLLLGWPVVCCQLVSLPAMWPPCLCGDPLPVGGLLSVSWFLCLQCGSHVCVVTPCQWVACCLVSWFRCLQCGPHACVVTPCLWVACCLSAGFSACNMVPMPVCWPLACGVACCKLVPVVMKWFICLCLPYQVVILTQLASLEDWFIKSILNVDSLYFDVWIVCMPLYWCLDSLYALGWLWWYNLCWGTSWLLL